MTIDYLCFRITFLEIKHISHERRKKPTRRRWFCFGGGGRRKKGIKSIVKNCFDVSPHLPLLLTYAGAAKNLILRSLVTYTSTIHFRIHFLQKRAEFLLLKCLCIISKTEVDWWLPFLWKHIMLKIFGGLFEVKSISHITERKYFTSVGVGSSNELSGSHEISNPIFFNRKSSVEGEGRGERRRLGKMCFCEQCNKIKIKPYFDKMLFFSPHSNFDR